jgi:phosphoglycerate dehydrogenase-like enzyme
MPDVQKAAVLNADEWFEIRITECGRVLHPEELNGEGVDWLVSEQFPQDFSRWPALKVAHCLAAGTDHLIGHPIWDSGVQLYTASGTNAQPIAEYATMMTLLLQSGVYRVLNFPESRNWTQRMELLGRQTLRGKTAGIIGYGCIGRETARQLSALGMNIVVMKRDPASRAQTGYYPYPGSGDPLGTIPVAWYATAQIRQMLPQCDVVIVCAPRNAQTTDLIGLDELRLLPQGASVIVVSRGGIVSEDALAEALKQQIIANAAVDCYRHEPHKDEMPLFGAPRCILTPHVAGVYSQAWPLQCDLLARNIRNWAAGTSLINITRG